MPGGRPVSFTEERRSNYLALLGAGVGRREAARQVGMSHRQVAAWRQAHDDFREACEDAEASANEPVVLALYQAACRGETWAVKLWLTNRDTGNWAEKVQVDQNVSGTVRLEAPGVADILELGKVLEARRLELGSGPETGAYQQEPAALEAASWEASDPGHETEASDGVELCDYCKDPIAGHTPVDRAACARGIDELVGDAHLPPLGA